MNLLEYNRRAWNHQVAIGNRWTIPVSKEMVHAAQQGDWNVVLTPQRPVPRSWFPVLRGLDVLCLACGGGQQGPIFAAAGARVTVLDNSSRQLEQDQFVARRDGLQIETMLGDMRDLSMFTHEAFDLVFNPCSLSFIPDAQPVFDEAHRVLRPGGLLMCGFTNPVRFIFDEEKLENGVLDVRHSLPYSDTTHLTEAEKQRLESDREPLMFSHSFEELITGQLKAGFAICDLFEDRPDDEIVSEYLPAYVATLAKR